MALPVCSCAEIYPALNKQLYQSAMRYTPSEVVRRQIVEMTIMSAIEHPELLFAVPIDKALFLLLNEVAAGRLGLIPDAVEDVLAVA